MNLGLSWCPGEDSNLHGIAPTRFCLSSVALAKEEDACLPVDRCTSRTGGAARGSRTLMTVRSYAPEAYASASFATAAPSVRDKYTNSATWASELILAP